MDHAIEGLKDYARSTAEMAKDYPDDSYIRKDLLVMIKALHVMEVHHYGKRVTEIDHILPKK